MGREKKVQATKELNKLDSRLYYIILAAILVISLTVRIKELDWYYTYDLQASLGAVFNLYTYYKLLGLVALFVTSVGILIYRNAKYNIKFKFDIFTISIGLIIISSIISTLATPLNKEAIWGFYTRNNGLLAYISLFGVFYIVSRLDLEAKHLRILSHVVNTLSILFISIGIFEFFGHYILNADWYKSIVIPSDLKDLISIDREANSHVGTSILSQQNYFGAYCSMIFPFITLLAIHSKKILDKVIFSVGSTMLFIGTYISVSMGPWLTLLVVLTLTLITFKHWKSYIHLFILLVLYMASTTFFAKYQPEIINETLNFIKYLFNSLNYKLLLLILPLALLFIFYYKFNKINKFRFVSLIILLAVLISLFGFIYILEDVVPNNKGLFTNRGYVWHYTYQMLKENFIIGYGPDTFYYYFPQDNPDTAIYSNNIVFDKPHNMFLQVFTDNGLLGIAGFMILLVFSLLTTLKATYVNQQTSESIFARAVFFVIIAYMIQGITNDNHMVIQPVLYLVIATGLSVCRKATLPTDRS